MKRNTFLQLALTAPLAGSVTRPEAATRDPKGFKVAVGEGRYHGPIQLKGVNQNVIRVKVSGRDTDGDLLLFEQTSLSPGRGTPMHVHPNQDEVFTVLEGEYLFQVGEEKHRLKMGEAIFLPRKVPHAWTQVSKRGKMMVLLQPAGHLEDFFVELAAFSHIPTPDEMARLFKKHDMEIVGPPLKID